MPSTKHFAPLALAALYASMVHGQDLPIGQINNYAPQPGIGALDAIDSAAGTRTSLYPQLSTSLAEDLLQVANSEIALAQSGAHEARLGSLPADGTVTALFQLPDDIHAYEDHMARILTETFELVGMPAEKKPPATIMGEDGHIDIQATFAAQRDDALNWSGAQERLERYAALGMSLTIPATYLPGTMIAAITQTELEKTQDGQPVQIAGITLQSQGYTPR